MNPAHVHLALNHLPVILVPLAAVLIACGAWRKRIELTGAGLILLVAATLAAGAVYLTGEPAEEVVESMPNVMHAAIEEHEEAALPAALTVGLGGLLAVFALVTSRRREGAPRWAVPATILVALAASAMLARTANLGGQIRHPEAQLGFQPRPE